MRRLGLINVNYLQNFVPNYIENLLKYSLLPKVKFAYLNIGLRGESRDTFDQSFVEQVVNIG